MNTRALLRPLSTPGARMTLAHCHSRLDTFSAQQIEQPLRRQPLTARPLACWPPAAIEPRHKLTQARLRLNRRS